MTVLVNGSGGTDGSPHGPGGVDGSVRTCRVLSRILQAVDLALHPGYFVHDIKYLDELLLLVLPMEALHHLVEEQQHLQLVIT